MSTKNAGKCWMLLSALAWAILGVASSCDTGTKPGGRGTNETRDTVTDSDGDGLTDAQEQTLGSNALDCSDPVAGGCVDPNEVEDDDTTTTGDEGDTVGVTFGAIIPPEEEVASRPQAINPYAQTEQVNLPSSVDLTDHLPPIGDQGNLGSCTAWAAGYGLATYTVNVQWGWGATTASHQASPGFLYSKLLEYDGFFCGAGTALSTAMGLLVQMGCSSLQTVPYSDAACPISPSTADAADFRIGSYNAVVPTVRNAVKGALADGSVVVFGTRLYDDFPYWVGADVYYGNGRFLTRDATHAAHAMALVGYDDSRGAYRVMNSWSSQWGDGGFAWMAYETFEATAYEAYAVVGLSPSPDDGGGDIEPPVVGDEPAATVTSAFQWYQYDYYTGLPYVYLIFDCYFSEPVYVDTVTVTDPLGYQGFQWYGVWSSSGYIYFVRYDGFQWYPGTYQIDYDVYTTDGSAYRLTVSANVDELRSAGAPKSKLFPRGRLVNSPGAENLPRRAGFESVLGANRQPATVIH